MEYYCGCKSVIYRNHRKILVTSSTTSIAYNLGTLSASETCTPMRTIDLVIGSQYMLCCTVAVYHLRSSSLFECTLLWRRDNVIKRSCRRHRQPSHHAGL